MNPFAGDSAHSSVRYTADWRLSGVSYTAKWRLCGVRFSAELHSIMKKKLVRCILHCGVAIAKQMKAATAFKGTIHQKNTQKFKLLSHKHDEYERKIFQSVLLLVDSTVYLALRLNVKRLND